MRNDFWNYSARNPRHQADTARTVEVIVGGSGSDNPSHQALLVDFSRQGAQLQMREQVPQGHAMVLRLSELDCGLDMVFPGHVRWCRPDGEGWLVGCLFDREVPLENLGELFLNEVLSKDPPQHSAG